MALLCIVLAVFRLSLPLHDPRSVYLTCITHQNYDKHVDRKVNPIGSGNERTERIHNFRTMAHWVTQSVQRLVALVYPLSPVWVAPTVLDQRSI